MCLWTQALQLEGVGSQANPARRVLRLTERTIVDLGFCHKHGNPLLLPAYELEGWTTTLADKFTMQDVIDLYKDHATHEQFHSEFKTDMDLERLPSGKFDTNFLVCSLAAVAMNILRLIGQKNAHWRRRATAPCGQEEAHEDGDAGDHVQGWAHDQACGALGLGARCQRQCLHVQSQRMGHSVLDFARVLRAGMNEPLVLLLRQRVGDLAFEVKVLLPADFQAATQAMRCLCQNAGRITPFHKHGRQHVALCRHRIFQTQDGGQGVDVEFHLARGVAGLHHGVGLYQAHHLAYVLHRVRRKNRFVADERCQHRVAGNVACQHTGRTPGINSTADASTNSRVQVALDAAQLAHLADIQHLVKIHVQLVDPQAHIGTTRHNLSLRMLRTQSEEFSQWFG